MRSSKCADLSSSRCSNELKSERLSSAIQRPNRGVKALPLWLFLLFILAIISFTSISTQQSEIIQSAGDITTIPYIGSKSTSNEEPQSPKGQIPIQATKSAQPHENTAHVHNSYDTIAAAANEPTSKHTDALPFLHGHTTTISRNMVDRIQFCREHQTPAGDSRYLATSSLLSSQRTNSNNEGIPNAYNTITTYNDILPYGLVMRDLAQRILSRDIAQSHVVVMGSNQTSSVAQNMYQRAVQEHHQAHFIDTTAATAKKIGRAHV